MIDQKSNTKETVLIIGGAIMGTMCAFFLKQEGFLGQIIVLEKDPTYQFSSTALSAASIRTQFGCSFNVQMSVYGTNFIKSLSDLFGPSADVGFKETGYLLLGTPDTDDNRTGALNMQNKNGANIIALNQSAMLDRFPWINTDDLGVSTFGTSQEGWLDAWSLLSLVKNQNKKTGVEYVTAKALELNATGNKILSVSADNNVSYNVDWVVNAAGPAAAEIVKSVNIELPVEPKKRTIFAISAPFKVDNFPMIFNVGGSWIRPEGRGFICGIGLPPANDPDASDDFEPDYHLFEDEIWPALAHRIPVLEQLRMERAWAGHYEVNTLDHNGIVGPHSHYKNLLFATGFSGHGIMHAPAVGRGIAELITKGAFQTIDMSLLGYGRIETNSPILEPIVY